MNLSKNMAFTSLYYVLLIILERRKDLYHGPDWNKEEMNSGELPIEPGRPSRLTRAFISLA